MNEIHYAEFWSTLPIFAEQLRLLRGVIAARNLLSISHSNTRLILLLEHSCSKKNPKCCSDSAIQYIISKNKNSIYKIIKIEMPSPMPSFHFHYTLQIQETCHYDNRYFASTHYCILATETYQYLRRIDVLFKTDIVKSVRIKQFHAPIILHNAWKSHED